ncbi:MAG: hypothetical protein UU09_C0016G0014 [Microgenomates group bacterium GW2011_GWA2_40_6]|nr:MAG: hypothetical protein UU09_C0016G0014 [Microgenomates group bacterium GW2011_GWA2_40_6]
MSKIKINLPDKIFGMDKNLLMVWVTPMLMLAVLLSIFLWVVSPKISEIEKVIKEIEDIKKKTVEVMEKRKYFLSVDQEELNNNANLLSSGVMPQKNSYLLVKIIKKVAESSGFQVSDFSVSMGDVKKQEVKQAIVDYEKVPVELTLSGPGEKYLELIKGLERSLPILSIDSFDLKINGQVALIKVRVSAYFQPMTNKINIESLRLTDMTLKVEETALLSKIKEYRAQGVESLEGVGGQYKSYERSDPFFTP